MIGKDILPLWLSIIGVLAFSTGVFAALIQGGFTGGCFALAMICACILFALDYFSRVRPQPPQGL